jgi:outer membrane protein OmpA-like peptidoglycan-associated protein
MGKHLWLFFMLIASNCFAQLRVTHNLSPVQLVKQVLLADSTSIQVLKVAYSGNRMQLGQFRADNVKYTNMRRGLVLSTGYAKVATGPNTSGSSGAWLHGKGDNDLTRLVNNQTFDAAILSIDFIPKQESIEFEFVFCSEEYPEYVNKGVSDVFAFILHDYESGEKKNLAKIPFSNEVVAVDQVNPTKNADFYIANGYWDNNNIRKWENDKPTGEFAWIWQYDGCTSWLKAKSDVTVGKHYSLKIAIADAGDGLYDSGVLLKQNSFKAVPLVLTELEKEKDELLRFFDKKDVQTRGDSLVLTLRLNFETDKAETANEKDLDNLKKVMQLMNRNPNLLITIEGHTDNQGTPNYNLELSKRRSLFAKKWLVQQGVHSMRMISKSFGLLRPVASNQTEQGRALNRRVEFVFYLE